MNEVTTARSRILSENHGVDVRGYVAELLQTGSLTEVFGARICAVLDQFLRILRTL